MATTIGELAIQLGLNSVGFSSGITAAKGQASQAAEQIKSSFSSIGNTIGNLGSQLGASFGPLGSTVSTLTQTFTRLGQSISSIGSGGGIGALASVFAGFGAAAVAAAAGVAELAVSGGKTIEEYDLMSQKTGIAIRDLQTLKAVGETVDVSLDSMAMGFRRLSKALAMQYDDTARSSVILKQLGVTAHDPYEAMLQIADGLHKIEDPSKRASEATALFGQRIAQTLLPALSQGRAAFEGMSKNVDEFGQYIGPEAVENQKKYKQSLTDMSIAWEGIKTSLSGTLPYLAAATKTVASFASMKWGFNSLQGAGGPTPDEKAKTDALKASIQANADATTAAENYYNAIKEHGPAELALSKAQEQIKQSLEDGTAAGFKDAAMWEKRLPLLKQNADWEKHLYELAHPSIASLVEDRRKLEKELETMSFQQEKEAESGEKVLTVWEQQKKDLEAVTARTLDYLKAGKALGDAQAESKKSGMEAGYKEQEAALKQQHAVGLISEKQYEQDLKTVYQAELADERALIQAKIDLAKAAASTATASGDKTGAYVANAQALGLQDQLNKLTAEYAEKIAGVDQAIQKTKSDWGTWARTTIQDVSSLNNALTSISHSLQSEFTTAITGFSNGLGKAAVEGKNLGKEMKEVAKTMAESFISAAAQMLIKYLLMKAGMGIADKSAAAQSLIASLAADKAKVISAAGVAGAEGTASFAGAPFPIDLGAPEFGAAMSASALSFGAAEHGGLIDRDDMIIAAHRNEMILPSPISQKIQNMTDASTTQHKGGDIHVHYSPTVHAIDGKGLGDVFKQHSHIIAQSLSHEMRRQNKG